MTSVIDDLRYAARVLSRSPLFTIVAIATLALGIGANSAMFSIIDAVLLRPLPFERSEDLYVVAATHQGTRREYTSFTDFTDWRARNGVFSHMAATRGDAASVTTPDGPEYLIGAAVSEDFFALFRVQPFLGRTFVAEEHRRGQDHVIVLSHALWLRRFGGNRGVVGMSLVLDGEPHTVIGVLPAGFAFPDDAELWRPLAMTASDANRRADLIRVIARLGPEIDPASAQAEMSGIARQLEQSHPATNTNWGVQLVPLHAKSVEGVRRTLLVLWGAVACVLLIACANVGTLLLSRSVRRAPELAVRRALGAGRARVVRQLLTESVLLATLGGLASVLVCTWTLAALRAVAPIETPRFQNIALDGRVLIFTAVVSLVVGLLAGMVPIRRVVRTDLQSVLRESASSVTSGVRHQRVMRTLVTGQLAVSIVLLIAAGLMIRTLERLQAVPLGFNSERLLTFYVSLPETKYPGNEQVRAFFDELLERLRALPDVQSASAINALYLHWSRAFVLPVPIEGRPAPDRAHPPDTHIRIVDPDIHRVLQVPVVRGRSFTLADRDNRSLAVVINETMATRYFAGDNPIGRRIAVRGAGPGQPIWQEIVGVVGDIRQQGLDADAAPEVHVPYPQSPINQMAILVRAAADPAALAPSIRAEIRRVDPNLPLTFMQTMDDVLAKSTAHRRFGMRLLAAFAGVALLLAAIGLYGVMASAMGERTREIALRLALGATPARVVRMVVRQIAIMAAVGVGAGIVIALGATRYIQPLLFGVTTTDPATYVATAALLVMVTMLSGYLPARRVTRIDPAATLRCE
jgi:putative ABC transport system permease protein